MSEMTPREIVKGTDKHIIIRTPPSVLVAIALRVTAGVGCKHRRAAS